MSGKMSFSSLPAFLVIGGICRAKFFSGWKNSGLGVLFIF